MSNPPSSKVPPAKGNPPDGEPETWTLDALKKHCETGVRLEMHTIPIYLFSAYCIKPEASAISRKIIGVVKQEMLHLALAGNILAAIGGEPKLYGLEYTPQYPCQIFFEPIDLHLLPPNSDAIETFVRLEAPAEKPDHPKGNIMPGYKTIGEFYRSFRKGIKIIHDAMGKDDPLFNPKNKDRQFTKSSYPRGLAPITTLEEAHAAMDLIVEQGEGTEITDPTAAAGKESHWLIFEELVGKDIPYYDAVQDPRTDDPKFSDNIKKAMRACDAVYCYLLLSIESVWTETNHRKDLVKNIKDLMTGILEPIAEWLVTQKVNDSEDSKHAAPPFNHYQFKTGIGSAKADMIRELQEAQKAYPAGPFSDVLEQAGGLFDLKGVSN